MKEGLRRGMLGCIVGKVLEGIVSPTKRMGLQSFSPFWQHRSEVPVMGKFHEMVGR